MIQIQGITLLVSYVYGDVLPEKAVTIYRSKDEVLDRSKIIYTENVVVIEGGNHACFGNYREQDGDGTAEISREEQQKRTVEAICSFMASEAQ